MALVDVTKKGDSIPVIEAVLSTSIPESVLKIGGVYLTGSGWKSTEIFAASKVLRYKGKDYSPIPFQFVKVLTNSLEISNAPANYVFMVGGKTFRVNAERTQILIIAGGEPILWRLIKSITSVDPINTSNVFLPAEQGIVTNGVAPTRFSYFYTLGEVYQNEPLQDGVVFRYIEPGSGAISWRKFAVAGEGGVFEEFAALPSAAIVSIKNIDFKDLQNLDQIIEALDTVDSKPFTAAIFSRDGKDQIDLNILVNGQDNQIENGLYYFSCIKGDAAVSTATRVSPYLKNTIAYIGRARCLVWQGDRFGQDEAWLRSDRPIGATSSAPRVSIGNGIHNWTKAKPALTIEQQLATLEAAKGVQEEKDTIALEEIQSVKTEMEEAIAHRVTSDSLKASLSSLSDEIDALDLSKADKATTNELNESLIALKTLVDAGASDEELAAEIKKVTDAIAELKKKSGNVRRYAVDGTIEDLDHRAIVVGKVALKLPKATLDRLIKVEILEAGGTLTAESGEQFYVFDGTTAIASTDGIGTLDRSYSEITLIGRATGGWDVVVGGSSSGSNADKVADDAIKPIIDKAIADLKKLQTIESSNPPDFDDPNWAAWIQRVYNYSVPSGTARAWLRTPNTNDGLPFPNSWTETVTPPTLADAKPDPSRVNLLALELPQGVRFRFPTTIPFNSSLSCDISFPAGVFTGISYQLVDANRAVISKTPKGQMVTDTDRAAGLGWASVPSNAKFAQFTFAYKNGGNLPFEFPITIT
jgi:hypothetical protein